MDEMGRSRRNQFLHLMPLTQSTTQQRLMPCVMQPNLVRPAELAELLILVCCTWLVGAHTVTHQSRQCTCLRPCTASEAFQRPQPPSSSTSAASECASLVTCLADNQCCTSTCCRHIDTLSATYHSRHCRRPLQRTDMQCCTTSHNRELPSASMPSEGCKACKVSPAGPGHR